MNKMLLNRFFGIFYVIGCTLIIVISPGFIEADLGHLPNSPKTAKYVFYFIGDGMGISQRAAASAYSGKSLTIEHFPIHGITRTNATDRFITDSAAAATAMASGIKTKIGYIGMSPHLKPVKTIGEMAKERGRKVGIISSVSLDHATPAAFYAHVPSRNMYYEIALDLVESSFDFFGGGGLKDPNGRKSKSPKGNVFDLARQRGYVIVDNKDDFMRLKPLFGQKVITHNPRLHDGQSLPYAIDSGPEDISLAEFTQKAIELLDGPDGFFIMVEGGKIDWACHANDAVSVIEDTLAFDEAVQTALEFYKKHSDETLIVVTADHETGGLALGSAGKGYETNFSILKNQRVSFIKFTDEIFYRFKKECGTSCRFEEIKPIITENFGLKFEGDPSDSLVVKAYQLAELKKAFKYSMKGEKANDPQLYLSYGESDPLTVTITHILNNNSGLGWTSFDHTGIPVGTAAIGVGAEEFGGYYDNIDLAKKIMSIMGLPAEVMYMYMDEAA